MATVINEEDAVDYYMQVTLVNGAKYEGIVFTYNPKEGLLVLFQNLGDGQPTMKMICTPYIKEYTIKSEAEKAHELPPQLQPFSNLPSMNAGRDKSMFKHASVQLKQAEGQRMRHFDSFDADTPIAACDAFGKIARLYPDISWDNDEKIIRVNNDVVITGTPDWTTPTAELVPGSPEKEKAMVDRIQKALDKK